MGSVRELVRATRTGALALCLVGGLFTASSAEAGVLNGHINAFTDVSNVTWTASTAFDNGSGLSGFVDWAVFGPGSFPFTGYTPTAGELTYAYQVFSTGPDAIHTFSLDLNGGAGANNIGSFSDLAGQVPSSQSLGAQAIWNFSGIAQSLNSSGLAFSALQVPTSFFGTVVNGGGFDFVFPLPTPSSNDIPEPASLALLTLGGMILLPRRK